MGIECEYEKRVVFLHRKGESETTREKGETFAEGGWERYRFVGENN